MLNAGSARINVSRQAASRNYGRVSDRAHIPPDAIDAPVLLTGRGGSGTRLISQLAAEAGIFIGKQR